MILCFTPVAQLICTNKPNLVREGEFRSSQSLVVEVRDKHTLHGGQFEFKSVTRNQETYD